MRMHGLRLYKVTCTSRRQGICHCCIRSARLQQSFCKEHFGLFKCQTAVTVLIIEGQVAPREKTIEELYTFAVGPVRFESNHLAFTTTKKTEKKIRVMPIINTSKEPATIEFEGLPAHLTLKATPATLKPGEKGLIEGTYDAKLNSSSWGNVNDLVRLKVNGKPMPNIYLYVSANLVEDFSA